VLEVLAQAGALVDLVATGARVIEPDRRVVSCEIYPPPPGGISMRTADPGLRVAGASSFVVASAETLAYAVATGAVGDPRSFKRPVRVTIPRALPTDDVLVLRDKKGGEQVAAKKAPALPATQAWKAPALLDVVEGLPRAGKMPAPSAADVAGIALVLTTLDEVRAAAERVSDLGTVRAVFAPFVPSNAVSALAGEGIAAFAIDAAGLEAIKGQKSVSLPAPAQWADTVSATFGKAKIEAAWLAIGAERGWTHAGTARQAPAAGAKK
jgi:aconitate hydratase